MTFLTNVLRLWLLVTTTLFTIVLASSQAQADTYNSEYDFWSGSGNGLGSISDDFEDGVITNWTVDNGTATETGGALVLQDPGVLRTSHFPSFDFIGETSSVQRDGVYVADGLGDFTIIASIKKEPIDTDYFVSITVGTADPSTEPATPNQFITVSLSNFGADIAQYPEFESGFRVGLYVVSIDSVVSGTEVAVSSVDSVTLPLDYNEVTGDYFLKLEFVDTTDSVTGSVSIDGGSTYTPIGSLVLPETGWAGGVGLQVDPRHPLAPAVVPAIDNAGMTLLVVLLGSVAYVMLRRTNAVT